MRLIPVLSLGPSFIIVKAILSFQSFKNFVIVVWIIHISFEVNPREVKEVNKMPGYSEMSKTTHEPCGH